MSEKTKPDTSDRLVAILDKKTMRKVEKLAARYGVSPEEVVKELVRLELSELPNGATIH